MGTLQGTSLLACCTYYSVLCMEMRSCHNSAAGNVYYSEETHVQKGHKETVCSRTLCNPAERPQTPEIVGDKDRSPKPQIQPCCSESSSKLALL